MKEEMKRVLEAIDLYVERRMTGGDMDWPRIELEDAFTDAVKEIVEDRLNAELQRGDYAPGY